MEQTDKAAFAELMQGLATYYRRELPQFSFDVYWLGLQQYDLAAVQSAVARHVQSPDAGKFMPLVADLKLMLEGRSEDRAALAWTKVDNAVRKVGTWHDVVFDDPLIHVVISEMGGWIAFGQKEEKDWPYIAKEFITRFRAYTLRQERPQHVPVLTGQANAVNGTTGREMAPPVLIGRAERAERVRLAGNDEPRLKITRPGQLPEIQQLQLRGPK